MPPDADELAKILDGIWQMLDRAAADIFSPLHTPVFSTVDAGGAAHSRTIVLRGFDRDRRELDFCTDARSPKVDHLHRNPRAAWLFYDAAEGIQLRIATRARVETTGAAVDALWQRLPETSRIHHASPHVPGAPLDAPYAQAPADLLSRPMNAEEAAFARANFALVICTIDVIDWLRIGEQGHRRARFAWSSNGTLASSWLAP